MTRYIQHSSTSCHCAITPSQCHNPHDGNILSKHVSKKHSKLAQFPCHIDTLRPMEKEALSQVSCMLSFHVILQNNFCDQLPTLRSQNYAKTA